MSRPTINDVALLAGVSKGTVSRVLNCHPKVSRAAREAVQHAIEQTGYQTNAHARSLATGRTNAIALVMASARAQLFADPTFAELINGVHEGMAGLDASLVMLLGGNDAEDARAVNYIKAGHVDGIIHLNPYLDDPIIPELADSVLPVVLCGPRPDLPQLPRNLSWVSADDQGGTLQALEHLAQRGARTIATIAGEPRGVAAALRLATYREWLGERYSPDLVAHGDYGTASGEQAMALLLDRRPDIDAVFCASDRMAVGALRVAAQRGRRVPEDLMIVGFDDHPMAAASEPALTTVRQPIRAIGRGAVEILISALRGERPAEQIYPTELIIREST